MSWVLLHLLELIAMETVWMMPSRNPQEAAKVYFR